METRRGGPCNIGLSDGNLSKKELGEKIQEHVPGFTFDEDAIGKDPDKRDYIVSNEKFEATGFKPQYSLDEGIREMIKGYRILQHANYANL